MNPPTTPELSLYQLAQSFSPQSSPLKVRISTFKALVDTLLETLIHQSLPATIWVKLPLNPVWLESFEQYQQTGLAEQIYLCSVAADLGRTAPPTASFRYNPPTGITSLALETSSQLKREYFVLVLSPQWCSLMVAQEVPTLSVAESTTFESGGASLKLIYSFDSSLIARTLNTIKQVITITDSTPEELLADSVPAFPLPSTVNAHFFSDLWQQSLQHIENLELSSIKIPTDNQTALPASSRFNEDFLNRLARELSLPLTNMKTALRLLESMQHKREARQRYLSLLQRECDRQNFLIVGLQEWAQLNRSLEGLETTVRLEDCVPGIVSTYQPIAEEKGISLGYTIPAGFPPVACPDSWLKQILRNLLHNSLKFTSAEGRVYVQAALKNDGVELIVTDSGMGIENYDLPKIFEVFYRGRNASSDEMSGAGLGLAIVQDLLQRCGGKISVVSQVGKGTTFKILLPIVH